MLHNYRELKVLILFSYYNRPLLVRNALRSVLRAAELHKNWHLAFGDDGSEFPGEPIVREELEGHLHKVSFHNTNDDIETKIAKGIRIGQMANRVLSATDADLVITLCDDDQLHPEYLRNLNRYFLKHRDVMYCYSNIHLYNPFMEDVSTVDNPSGPYNEHTTPIHCYGKVDGSQVAYRTRCIWDHNIWYRDTTKGSKGGPEKPWQYNLDGELFKQFHEKIGLAHYTGFVSQYKGMHEYQMVYRKEHIFQNQDDIRSFHRDVVEKAGKVF
jgi:hypothetical protein